MITEEKLFFFDAAQLNAIADQHRDAYLSAQPFPHTVIDHFLPESVLEEILEEFPAPKEIEWRSFYAQFERKMISKDESQLGPRTRHLIAQLHSSTVCRFLHRLTGLSGLVPDPHLLGGGLHQMERGGFLKVHADFNMHDELRLNRRINLIVYLNRNWQEEYGGHLELWDDKMTRCVKRVLPIFNRCIIFNTVSTGYHGNPDPLNCPPDVTRKSLCLFYYTNGRPEEEARPAHSTIFQLRPQERAIERTKQLLLKLTPPIVVDTVSAIKRWTVSRSR